MTWSRARERTGSIGLVTEAAGARLVYTASDRDGARIDISELVPFTYTTTRFGGRRQWFACLGCHQRCRVIYGGLYFRCRRCHGLRYQLQREPFYDRAIERANRIRMRLGDTLGNAFEDDDVPPKPSRMRWKTYRKLKLQYAALQCRWKAGAAARFGLRF